MRTTVFKSAAKVFFRSKNAAAQAQRQRVNAVIRDRKADSIFSKNSERKPHGFKHHQPLGPDYLKFRRGLDGSSEIPVSPQHLYEQTIC